MLEKSGELYMLVLEHDAPRCLRWAIDASAHRLTRTEGVRDTLTYRTTSSGLVLENFARETPDGRASTTCTATVSAKQIGDDVLAVTIDHREAQWFATHRGCQAAIAGRARVATELPCDLSWDDAVPPDHQDASRRRFERILAKGGTMFATPRYTNDVERCTPVRFRARRRGPAGAIEGVMSYRVEFMRGVESYGYSHQAGDDTVTLSGSNFESDDQTVTASRGCLEIYDLVFGVDSVGLIGQLHFSAKACRRALAEQRTEQQARETWLPPLQSEVDHDPSPSLTVAPLVGGC